jgi:hypothetical protein
VSSLWTPQGEHRVPRDGGPGGGSGAPEGGDGDAGPEQDAGLPGDHATEPATAAPESQPRPHPGSAGAREAEEEALARAELDELRAQLLAAPAADVIANHAFGLFELAALHLSAEPPHIDSARLAIDAMGALVEGLGGRLGDGAGALRDGLSQIRLAFVKISQAGPAVDGGSPVAEDSDPPS